MHRSPPAKQRTAFLEMFRESIWMNFLSAAASLWQRTMSLAGRAERGRDPRLRQPRGLSSDFILRCRPNMARGGPVNPRLVISIVPAGTRNRVYHRYPALKRWAIVEEKNFPGGFGPSSHTR